MLSIQSLSKTFSQEPAVDNVSFDLPGNTILCLLGPSGCGKTTLLRLVAGLEYPDRGGLFIEDEEITAIPAHRRKFGMMFQEFALFPHKNVYENVVYGLEIKRYLNKSFL